MGVVFAEREINKSRLKMMGWGVGGDRRFAMWRVSPAQLPPISKGAQKQVMN